MKKQKLALREQQMPSLHSQTIILTLDGIARALEKGDPSGHAIRDGEYMCIS